MKNTINNVVAKIYIENCEPVIKFNQDGVFPLRTSEHCLAMLSDTSDDTAVEILTYIDDIALTKLKQAFGFDVGMIERDIKDLGTALGEVIERFNSFTGRSKLEGFTEMYCNRMITLEGILSLDGLEVGIKTS